MKGWKPEDIIKIRWIRGKDNIYDSFYKASMFSPVAIKGAGKSALVEAIGGFYPKVLDLFGSRDNEGLAWLRTPFGKDALLVKDASVELESDYDVMDAGKIMLRDIQDHSCLISCAFFHPSFDRECFNLSKIVKVLWRRHSWREPWFVLIREASNLLYSRMPIGDTQILTKNQMVYLFREMRHSGLALGIDALRWLAIDINIRALSDYTFFKRSGVLGLPKDLRFMYRHVHPVALRKLPVDKFLVLNIDGDYGLGKSKLPFWHKQEHEDLLTEFKLDPQYKRMPYLGDKGKNVGDFEHARIVKARFEHKDEKGKQLSMGKIGQAYGRSSKTIYEHLTKHNNQIHVLGYCESCQSVRGKYASEVVDTKG